jgi:hypothetical protein
MPLAVAARLAHVVACGIPHHVTQRGNRPGDLGASAGKRGLI